MIKMSFPARTILCLCLMSIAVVVVQGRGNHRPSSHDSFVVVRKKNPLIHKQSAAAASAAFSTKSSRISNDSYDLISLRGGGSAAQDSLLVQTGVVHQFLETIDVLGTFVFAFAGAYKAGKKGMDLLGMMILASITAIGGGTVRDLLLGTEGKAIFWLRNPIYIQISFVTTLLTYLVWPRLEREFGIQDSARAICTADAFAMSAFCVLGTKRGVEQNLPAPMWVVSGVITSVFGGIIRDILCGEPPRAMYPYKSMLSAGPILGSTIYTILSQDKNMDLDLVSSVAFLVTFSIRTWSFDNPWRLPHWADEQEKVEITANYALDGLSDGNVHSSYRLN